jgi:hypothetical protein
MAGDRLFGSSGRTSNPLGAIAMIAGAAGTVCGSVLWVYQLNPESTILGRYSAQLATGGNLRDELMALAAVLGAMAVIGGILSAFGGRAKGSSAIGLVLGVIALTYPVLSSLNIVVRPLRPNLFS